MAHGFAIKINSIGDGKNRFIVCGSLESVARYATAEEAEGKLEAWRQNNVPGNLATLRGAEVVPYPEAGTVHYVGGTGGERKRTV